MAARLFAGSLPRGELLSMLDRALADGGWAGVHGPQECGLSWCALVEAPAEGDYERAAGG